MNFSKNDGHRNVFGNFGFFRKVIRRSLIVSFAKIQTLTYRAEGRRIGTSAKIYLLDKLLESDLKFLSGFHNRAIGLEK